MGGRKKPSISQLEKKARKTSKGKEEKKKVEMTLNASGELTQVSMDAIIKEVKKMKYVTPYILSSKFGIKMSRAKKVLKTLEAQGILSAYDLNHRVPIYVPVRRK